MPIFEYQCQKCSHRFEIIQGSFSRREEIRCPRCGFDQVQRLVSLCSNGPKTAGADSAPACAPRPGRFS